MTATVTDGTNTAATAIARDQLRSIIERLERLIEDKKAVGEDVKEVYAEAKGNGFDVKAIRACIKLRAIPETTRNEQEAVLDLYMSSL